MRRDQRKLCEVRKGGLLKRANEAETRRKVLRRGKNLASREATCPEKERVRSRVTPRKVGMGLKQRGQLNKRRCGWKISFMVINRKRGRAFERKTAVLRQAL